MQEQVGFRVALRQLLLAFAHDVRHVAEQRDFLGDAKLDEVTVQHNLARGGAQQVFATQHDIDAHHRIVHRVGERVQRVAVRADDHVIRHGSGLELDAPADQVVEGDVLIGHADTQRRLTAFCAEGGLLLVGQIAVETVIAKSLRAAGGDVTRLDLFRRRIRFVGVPGFEQLGGDVLVNLGALGLTVWAVRAADLDALVPVDVQPLERVENLVVAFLAITLRVGVLDTEHESAVRVACFRPVEQGGADHAHMRRAGRRRAEPHTHVLRQLGLDILAFFVVSFGHTLYCAAREGRGFSGYARLRRTPAASYDAGTASAAPIPPQHHRVVTVRAWRISRRALHGCVVRRPLWLVVWLLLDPIGHPRDVWPIRRGRPGR